MISFSPAELDCIIQDHQCHCCHLISTPLDDAPYQTHKALYHIISVWLRQEKLPVSCWSCHLQMCLQSVNSTMPSWSAMDRQILRESQWSLLPYTYVHCTFKNCPENRNGTLHLFSWETACVLLVLSLANVPAECKLHNAIIISYGHLTRITMMFRTLHMCTLHI